MFPSKIQLETGTFSGRVSWGAGGDSAYEYLLKRWLQVSTGVVLGWS